MAVNNKIRLIWILPALALAACQPAATDESDAASEAPAAEDAATPASSAAPAPPALEGQYWTVRPELIAASYTPVENSEPPFSVCPEDMEGTAYEGDACPSPEVILPEVEGCAGTGTAPCRIAWRSPEGAVLTIFTEGEPQPGLIRDHEWSGDEGETN